MEPPYISLNTVPGASMKKKWFGRKVKSYSSRITLEQLEERIVLDASVPATSVDNPDNPDNTQVEQQAQQANTPDAQNAPTQAAADVATSSDPFWTARPTIACAVRNGMP